MSERPAVTATRTSALILREIAFHFKRVLGVFGA